MRLPRKVSFHPHLCPLCPLSPVPHPRSLWWSPHCCLVCEGVFLWFCFLFPQAAYGTFILSWVFGNVTTTCLGVGIFSSIWVDIVFFIILKTHSPRLWKVFYKCFIDKFILFSLSRISITLIFSHLMLLFFLLCFLFHCLLVLFSEWFPASVFSLKTFTI